MVEANSAGPALLLTTFALNTGSANSALATIETAAMAMHSALTIQRPRRKWVLAAKKSPRLRVERAARVGGNWRTRASAAAMLRAAERPATSCWRRGSSERLIGSSCSVMAEAVFMAQSVVHTGPPRGGGLRLEIAEYSRGRPTRRWDRQRGRQPVGVPVCAIRSLGLRARRSRKLQPGERWAPGHTETR